MDHSADDLAIYITTRSQRVASRVLQGVTNKLIAWAAERGLTFFPSKMVSMAFRKRNKKPKLYPLKKYPVFAITQDSRLNWEEYIKKLRANFKYYKGGSNKKMGRRSENPKKFVQRDTKREDMVIYTDSQSSMHQRMGKAHNNCRQYENKLSRIRTGHTRLTFGHLMLRNNQQPTCGKQSLTIKNCL